MILVVGEQPGRVLFRSQTALGGLCGSRLAKLAGTTLGDFIRRTDRRNLIKERTGWDVRLARDAAQRLTYEFPEYGAVILCGRKVATAWGLETWPFLASTWIESIDRRKSPEVMVFPHPSGKNRWWNNEDNVAGARRVMQRIWESYA